MIKLTDNIWIGDSADGLRQGSMEVSAILNVAQDLSLKGGWPDVEYMQIGLIDGPGNHIGVYVAAVLALTALVEKHKVLVCCHSGGRALAVVLMYLNTQSPREWDSWIELLSERTETDLPVPHLAHRAVFNKIYGTALKEVTRISE